MSESPSVSPSDALTQTLAARLRLLRQERGLSLEELAARSGVSRTSLSRLENAEVSPTAEVLGKLCNAFNLSMTRLMSMVEQRFDPLVSAAEQTIWQDREAGYARRVVSPPSPDLAGEVVQVTLRQGAVIAYPAPDMPGAEHHLVLTDGVLDVSLGEQKHELHAGDCLRYRLREANTFRAPAPGGARYLLFLI